MTLPSFARRWLNGKAFAPRRARPATTRSDRRRIRPQLEALEDRCVPSTVTNLADNGPGSLRDAIANTPAGGTVDFQPGLSGTISLTSGELAITKDLTIAGPGASAITVSGNHTSRVFDITTPSTVVLSGLTMANGLSPTDRGGGIHNLFGNLTVTDSILSGNSASGLGGGIENEAGKLTVINSTLSGNSAFDGGGIWSNGPLTVINSTLSGNSANGALSAGGGIFNSGSARVTGSTLSGNSASFGGGILNDNVGTLVLLNSTLSGNSAITNGLGTGFGGAIESEFGGSLALTSCTVSGNSADRLAGGIHADNGNALSLSNTIIAGDRAQLAFFSPDLVASGPVNSQGHNLIGDGSSASGFTATDLVGTSAHPIDPMLGPLQDNGGPTQTMALLPGSPALNAGDPAQVGVADQRGVVRSDGVNIGAYQASASAFALTAPAPATAGVPFDLVVTAVDAFGQTAVGYTGTVTFSTTDTNPGVVLPANYTFTSADAGRHTFAGTTTLVRSGSQTVTATDAATSSITGAASVTVNPAAATHLVLTASSDPVQHQAWSLTVTAYDAFGNVATGYTGTVTFSSSDDKAILPADYTFTAADAGTHSFSVTFHRKGQQLVTVTDTLHATIFGTIDVLVHNPGEDGH